MDTIRAALQCDRHEAWQVAKHLVLALSEEDYSETVRLVDGHLADVYGIMMFEAGWYLKLMIDHRLGETDIVSCHLAERDIRTRRSVVRQGRINP